MRAKLVVLCELLRSEKYKLTLQEVEVDGEKLKKHDDSVTLRKENDKQSVGLMWVAFQNYLVGLYESSKGKKFIQTI